MRFNVEDNDKPEPKKYPASQMLQGDIAVIMSGPRYVGGHLLCTFYRNAFPEKSWTMIEDPKIYWCNWIPEDMIVRPLKIGESFTVTREE